MNLVITRAGEEHTFPGISDLSSDSDAKLGRALWQVAFSAPVGLVQSSASRFGLRIDDQTVELPRPQTHRGRSAP